jgi:Z1 domain
MNLADIVRNTFGGMATGPKPLKRALEYNADDDVNIFSSLFIHLASASSADLVFNLFNRQLSVWDYEASSPWVGDTEKNTLERRRKIYSFLALIEEMTTLLNEKFPPNLNYERPIVIARKHQPWYDLTRQTRDSFYREAYAGYLRQRRQWSEEQIGDLEESTRLVAERLSDPENEEIFPVRGLVVGYVQSGKTANFTGVIARAADAGYRLVIVLAGTLNILRSQTQRRIDRELIGRPFITAENEESYASDLGSFIDHGGFPADIGGFNWHRLTNIEGDYKRLKQGIQSLEFRKHDKTKPFNDRENLRSEDARLLIVKKVPAVLNKVAADLNAIKSRLADIPTLVIDDESDQASVNTRKPTKKEIEERTATNSAIVSLLQQLPRAQYVGYTATPFANVFIDPNIAENLFPRDFIISLPRPANYMGVSDFHDLERDDKTVKGPNERAFVRDVKGEDSDALNMERAVDSYILTGAIKLYRQECRPELTKNYRHHTMLVHSSQFTSDHGVMAGVIKKVLDEGGYLTGTAWKRLEKLWSDDFAPVSAQRANGYPIPASFDDIRPFLSQCWGRLISGTKPVLIVNGDANDNPDFESESVWKIVVGGAKLSRGYTIEGLTISYYRRRAAAADALMQMGRWFGFRDGYRDLVRLYIGREEPSGKGTVDLYAAFEGVCRDEVEFRNELKKYAYPEDGIPILPVQVPPLVPSHLLQPTAKNKMYNAVVDFQNYGGVWKEPTLAPFEEMEIETNQQLLIPLLGSAVQKGSLSITVPGSEKQNETVLTLSASWREISSAKMLVFLKSYVWIDKDKGVLHREIKFLESKEKTCVDKWLFLCIEGPRLSKTVDLAGHDFRPFNRARISTQGRFGVYSESDHRELARYLCGIGFSSPNNEVTKKLRSAKQGIFVFYPTRDLRTPEAGITPGFALQFPSNDIATPIRFGVRVKEKADAVVVNV